MSEIRRVLLTGIAEELELKNIRPLTPRQSLFSINASFYRCFSRRVARLTVMPRRWFKKIEPSRGIPRLLSRWSTTSPGVWLESSDGTLRNSPRRSGRSTRRTVDTAPPVTLRKTPPGTFWQIDRTISMKRSRRKRGGPANGPIRSKERLSEDLRRRKNCLEAEVSTHTFQKKVKLASFYRRLGNNSFLLEREMLCPFLLIIKCRCLHSSDALTFNFSLY